MNPVKKTFDCVDMQRKIRDKIDAETEDMSFEELKCYIKQGVEKLHERIQALNEKEKLASKAKVKPHH